MNRKRRRAVAKVRRRGAPAAGGSRAADARLREAVAHLQAGRLTEAEPIYVDILAGDAEHVVALHHYGVIHIRRGEPSRAAELIGKAIAGDRSVLTNSRIRANKREFQMPDLLYYQDRIQSVWEWPLHTHVRRIAFYVILPPLAWVLAALVETLVGTVL